MEKAQGTLLLMCFDQSGQLPATSLISFHSCGRKKVVALETIQSIALKESLESGSLCWFLVFAG
uniref:Uncharacterized protein n=1 Tax=Anguilla anguilla TaxID=7936 RepID=A0A0E9QNG5_ANGAN